MQTISKETAGDFLVNYQDLGGLRKLEGHDGVRSYMQRVRCIQYDPLDVAGRNADLVLQARVKDYRKDILEDLLYKERYLADGVDKVMSVILTEDYPKMTRVRKAASEVLIRTLSYRGSLEALDMLDDVKEYIRANGPQSASSIDTGGRAEPGRWGHKKLSSAALDYLYNSGQLGIYEKKKTQKIYDLVENLFDRELLGEDPFGTEHEFLRWYVKRRIGSIGLVWNRNTGAWTGNFLQDRNMRTRILRELTDEGELTEISIEGSDEIFYMRSEDTYLLGKPVDNNTVRFIAPLDNILWDREMTEEIFGFRYRWEVYTPAAKRQYGYYVLPVLYKNRFIARFEPERNRGDRPLRIKNWWWEPDVNVSDEMRAAADEALRRFGGFLGVEAEPFADG